MRRTRVGGFTLVEVLVAVAVMGVLLAFVAVFFSQQRHYSERLQATAEVHAKARSVGELLAQDLELAGSTTTVNASGLPSYEPVRDLGTAATSCTSVESQGCVELHADTSPVSTSTSTPPIAITLWLTLWYRSSIDAPLNCHRVDYGWDATNHVLYRTDQNNTCPYEGTAAPFQSSDALARQVTSFGLQFTCDTGSHHDDPAACYTVDSSFVRTGSVTVTAISADAREAVASDFNIDAPMANMRPAVNYGGGGATP